MPQKQFVADFSLALINRTGAYYVCRDVVEGLPQFFLAVRYWRLFLAKEPRGMIRKLLGRAMLLELNHLPLTEALPRARTPGEARALTLFFDPLYVLCTHLGRDDIVLCHDLGPVTHPELFDTKTSQLYRMAYERIRKIGPGMVFVSEASRAAFAIAIDRNCRFQQVIRLYVRERVDAKEGQPPAGIQVPFLLTVGGLEKRKNYRRIIEAFRTSGLQQQGFSYVFCGPRGNDASEIEALAATAPGVRWLGYLSDAELRWLYSKATGFVLPSLLEGFGLPALEAAQHGLVSIISEDAAQTEAAGDGAIFVNPTSVGDIASAMRWLVEMPQAEREARIALARAQGTTLSRQRYLESWAGLLASQ